MPTGVSVIVLLAAIGGGFSLFLLLRAVTAGPGPQLRKRLARLENRGAAARDPDQAMLRRTEDQSRIPGLDTLVKFLLPRPAMLRQRLQRTGRHISLGEYGLVCFVVGGISGVVFHQFAGLPPAVSVLFGLSIGLIVPHGAINFMIGRRLKAFVAEFPEAIDLIVRGLKSGLPIPESIRNVAKEMRGPVSEEFGQVTEKMKLGVTLDDALVEITERITVPEYRFFVISLSVQRETGGNLAETLENLSDILRQRRQMRLKIKAMSSEANASAAILGSLPFALFAILALVNYQYVSLLFTDPRGHIMLGGGLFMLAIGVGVMRKLARFEI